MNVHEFAVAGFQKGSNYNDNRPTFTDEAVTYIAKLLADLNVGSEQDISYDVLELGAGTGLFTRKILSVLPKGTRFLATEPSEGFLKTLQQESPDVETRQCAANSIPLRDSSVKMIICAQCFHWFANNEALDEMNRVLIRGGKLVMIWNAKDYSVPWLKEIFEYNMTLGDRPYYKRGFFNQLLDEYPGFVDRQFQEFPGVEFKGSQKQILDTLGSISTFAKLPEEERQKCYTVMRQIMQKYEESRQDIMTMPFKTDIIVLTCHKDV